MVYRTQLGILQLPYICPARSSCAEAHGVWLEKCRDITMAQVEEDKKPAMKFAG